MSGEGSLSTALITIGGILFAVLIMVPWLVSLFLRNVEAGTIRMVSWYGGGTRIYRGPGKSWEIPLLTTGTTLSSKAINVDLDITDQTADIDQNGVPRPIKVRVLASAIVSVGDTDQLIKTAANRFFSKPQEEQLNILIDLLSSSARRAINLLTHDQLFSAKTTPRASQGGTVEMMPEATPVATREVVQAAEDDDDPLAIIIRKACSRELTDLGLQFNSLNIKVVQSEVAEARRRQSAAEAQANADIVAAQQTRRSKEAQIEAERSIAVSQRELEQARAANAAMVAEAEILKVQATEVAEAKRRQAATEAQANADIVAAEQSRRAREAQLQAERAISDNQRQLEQTRAENAVIVAQAEAKRQDALAVQREAELRATQIAQATADADRLKIGAQAQAEAEAVRILRVAEANAESIRKVNEAIMAGGESYFRYRQIELLPEIAPMIAQALSQAKLVTISAGDGKGAADTTANNITSVIQTMLAAQMVSRGGILDSTNGTANGAATGTSNGITPTQPV
jgi:flotillin